MSSIHNGTHTIDWAPAPPLNERPGQPSPLRSVPPSCGPSDRDPYRSRADNVICLDVGPASVSQSQLMSYSPTPTEPNTPLQSPHSNKDRDGGPTRSSIDDERKRKRRISLADPNNPRKRAERPKDTAAVEKSRVSRIIVKLWTKKRAEGFQRVVLSSLAPTNEFDNLENLYQSEFILSVQEFLEEWDICARIILKCEEEEEEYTLSIPLIECSDSVRSERAPYWTLQTILTFLSLIRKGVHSSGHDNTTRMFMSAQETFSTKANELRAKLMPLALYYKRLAIYAGWCSKTMDWYEGSTTLQTQSLLKAFEDLDKVRWQLTLCPESSSILMSKLQSLTVASMEHVMSSLGPAPLYSYVSRQALDSPPQIKAKEFFQSNFEQVLNTGLQRTLLDWTD